MIPMRIDLTKCKSNPETLLARILNEVPDNEWPQDWVVEPQGRTRVLQETKDRRWVTYDLQVDFLFTCSPTEEDPFRPMMQVAVECDSRAYHDLKPEQIDKDRWRDRKLVSEGVFVLRYSASQIHQDPKAVVDEVLVTLESIGDSLDPIRWFFFSDSAAVLFERCEAAAIERLRRLKKGAESLKKG